MKKDPLVYVQHIANEIEKIENSSQSLTKEEFLQDVDLQDAIVRRIEIIGEAVKNLPDNFIAKYRDIPWKKIAGTRDIVIHSYFNVDYDLVWDIVEHEIPDLKPKIQSILEKIN